MLATEFRVAVSPVLASPVLRRLLPAFAVSAVGDGMSALGVAVAAQHTLLASATATIASGLAATALLTTRRRELARPRAGRHRPWRTHGLSPGGWPDSLQL